MTLAAALLLAAAGPAPTLSLPLACRPGADCFIQQYVDHDPGPGATDHLCGTRAYDGHRGTDIRLTSTAAQRRGVAVLAAAAGAVRAVRDGEPDRPLVTEADRAQVLGRECGNGVVLDHGGGWETQYCHLARGSLAVRPGQRVTAGDRLGQVGLSGDTQFPHLHLEVRHDGHVVDPFAPDLPQSRCSPGPAAGTLWSRTAARALAYRATEIINSGFATGPVTMDAIEDEAVRAPAADPDALVFYGRAIGLREGDRLTVTISAPDGSTFAENSVTMASPKAQWMLFAGRRRPADGWSPGTYRAVFAVENAGVAEVRREATLRLVPR